MKIKMLKTTPGSTTGIDVFLYEEGEIYDTKNMSTDLVDVFLKNKFAEEVKGVEIKMQAESPENKMASVEEDKEKKKALKDANIKPITEKGAFKRSRQDK